MNTVGCTDVVVKRADSARRTELAVIDAARALFLDTGYGSTTIKQIAQRAGVSQETVYKRFGSKAAVLKCVYDVTLAGDLEDKPMADRGLRGLAEEPDAAAMLAGYVRFALDFHERVGPLVSLARQAQGTEPDLKDFVRTIDGERRTGAGFFVRACASKGFVSIDPDRAADEVWLLTSFALLGDARSRGWSDDEIVDWIVASLRAEAFA
ncbi:TetR/AcrR family transcriptional regulator [Branchiibius hedensis]|uniref:TetR/AcrR family transcriptional regulator n=1 Tax=Branchiibius hedensis TaxID=672460 RepID=UPI0014728028|nr:TetR/AcrR family transcriptional regulator [Branchiibius hedensis]